MVKIALLLHCCMIMRYVNNKIILTHQQLGFNGGRLSKYRPPLKPNC